MHRSEITIDLRAVARNVRTLLDMLEGAELWAVVKGDGYGHGALDVGRAALGAGATALCVASGPLPEGVPVHLKLDTGMGRWGLSELPSPSRHVVGLMTHLATAESDAAFAEQQLERFREATDRHRGLTRHAANSAAALRLPSSRLDAARCGIAVYGLSPFGRDPAEDGLEPVLSWRSRIAQARTLRAGESTGYGRRFV